MKRLIAISVVVVFAALLCQVAFSEGERPARPLREGVTRPAPLTEEQRAEMRKAMERLREIRQNEELREVTVEARRDESVRDAYEAVRAAQEALSKAQETAEKALDRAIIKIAKEKKNEGLIKMVKERREILEKLQQLRPGFPRGAMMGAPRAGERRAPVRR